VQVWYRNTQKNKAAQEAKETILDGKTFPQIRPVPTDTFSWEKKELVHILKHLEASEETKAALKKALNESFPY
jgi:hypothetical protein